MPNKLTKEELLKNNIALELENKELIKKEWKIKTEFAKAFGWVKKYNNFASGILNASYEDENPSWEKIFTEIGSLLAKQKTLQYVEGFEELNLKVRELGIDIENIKQTYAK